MEARQQERRGDDVSDAVQQDIGMADGGSPPPSPECSGSASPDWRMAAEMKRKHDECEDMEGRLCNPVI